MARLKSAVLTVFFSSSLLLQALALGFAPPVIHMTALMRPHLTHIAGAMMCAGEGADMKARKTIVKAKAASNKVKSGPSGQGEALQEMASAGRAAGAWDLSVSLESLRERQAEFARERTWDQHHTPRNLALAMVGEVQVPSVAVIELGLQSSCYVHTDLT